MGRNQRQAIVSGPVNWRSAPEKQQPLRAAQCGAGSRHRCISTVTNPFSSSTNVPQAESRRLGEKEAPCFHLQRNTWRLEGDLGKDRAKKELEKQEQLASVIVPWEPERASSWFVLGAGRSAGAVQEHVQNHSDRIPFLSKTVGASTHQPHAAAWATTSRCKSDTTGETRRRASPEPVTARPSQEGPHLTKGERHGNTRPTAAASAGS